MGQWHCCWGKGWQGTIWTRGALLSTTAWGDCLTIPHYWAGHGPLRNMAAHLTRKAGHGLTLLGSCPGPSERFTPKATSPPRLPRPPLCPQPLSCSDGGVRVLGPTQLARMNGGQCTVLRCSWNLQLALGSGCHRTPLSTRENFQGVT